VYVKRNKKFITSIQFFLHWQQGFQKNAQEVLINHRFLNHDYLYYILNDIIIPFQKITEYGSDPCNFGQQMLQEKFDCSKRGLKSWCSDRIRIRPNFEKPDPTKFWKPDPTKFWKPDPNPTKFWNRIRPYFENQIRIRQYFLKTGLGSDLNFLPRSDQNSPDPAGYTTL